MKQRPLYILIENFVIDTVRNAAGFIHLFYFVTASTLSIYKKKTCTHVLEFSYKIHTSIIFLIFDPWLLEKRKISNDTFKEIETPFSL